MKKIKLGLWAIIFMINFIIFVLIFFFYAGMEEETASYGMFNGLLIALSDVISFPFHMVINTSSALLFLIGYFINLILYTIIIYFLVTLFQSRKIVWNANVNKPR